MAKLNALLNQNITHGSQTYSTAGTYTWTCPDGVGVVYLSLVGGGGGGGGGASAIYNDNYDQHFNLGSAGGGGGAGIYGEYVATVVPGNSYTVVVGAAGTAGKAGPKAVGGYDGSYNGGFEITTSGAGGNGGNGGQSKFNDIIVPGGSGGKGATMISWTNYPSTTSLTSGGGAGASTINRSLLSGHRVIFNSAGKAGNNAGVGTRGWTANTTNVALKGGSGGTGSLSAGGGGAGGNGGVFTNSYSTSATAGTAGSKGSAGKVIIRW